MLNVYTAIYANIEFEFLIRIPMLYSISFSVKRNEKHFILRITFSIIFLKYFLYEYILDAFTLYLVQNKKDFKFNKNKNVRDAPNIVSI